MTLLREDFIHLAIRIFLKRNDWRLIAGQYPNGSDDEVPSLNIMDSTLAKDNSPDHRRHSMNKLVPDIVSLKSGIMFIIEVKPVYSKDDEDKLEYILSERVSDLENALYDLVKRRGVNLETPINELIYVPCLGFGFASELNMNRDFCYFIVQDLKRVKFLGNKKVAYL